MTGSRSFSESYCRFIRYGLTEWVSNTNSQVLPSAGDLATVVVPAAPEAPGLFSMIKLTPSRCCIPVCTSRASTSVEPPGGKGTTNRTAAEGQVCACTRGASSGAAAAPSTVRLVSVDTGPPVFCRLPLASVSRALLRRKGQARLNREEP
jgi:hypothetical protein